MKFIDPRIEEYSVEKSDIPSSFSEKIERYTRENVHGAHMLIGKLEASILGFLLRSIEAKRVLELGTFTGYSALSMAENIPSDGEVMTLDINQETVEIAKKFWSDSPNGYKIKPILGQGMETILNLEGEFDFIFIDADKKNYVNYLKMLLPKLSKKGIVVIDNVLWSGRVLPNAEQDLEEEHRNTKFIREVNDYIKSNSELYGTLLPVRDGMFLVQRKKNL